MDVKIIHFYPDLMSLYGSYANVALLRRHLEDLGNAVTVDTVRCIIQGGEKLIAAVGLEDMIIVDTPDALLVCDKSDAGSIKKVLENLKICNRNEYL